MGALNTGCLAALGPDSGEAGHGLGRGSSGPGWRGEGSGDGSGAFALPALSPWVQGQGQQPPAPGLGLWGDCCPGDGGMLRATGLNCSGSAT